METESAPSKRPRPWLLVALLLAVVVAGAAQFWPTNPAPAGRAASNPRRQPGAAAKGEQPIDPADLNVRLGELKAPRPEAEGTARNPFRFQPKPPPPPPPAPKVDPKPIAPPVDAGPPPPPPPPPIPLKFIGTVEPKPGDRVAAFSDCRYTFRGREGEIIDGRYRLVKIGVESVVMEHVDGRGRTTIRLSGQECIGK